MRIVFGLIATMAMMLSVHAQELWQQKVREELPLLGHRNWIVIVDSAYPLESAAGAETIETGQGQLVVLDFVLEAIKNSRHVRPLVHTDAELQYVPENEAPGIGQYRRELRDRLTAIPVDSILHQKLIDQVNELSHTFHVLILKSTMTLPYTPVFLQLDCKYWSAESEDRLRKRMAGDSGGPR